jgi:hypothetical protein
MPWFLFLPLSEPCGALRVQPFFAMRVFCGFSNDAPLNATIANKDRKWKMPKQARFLSVCPEIFYKVECRHPVKPHAILSGDQNNIFCHSAAR